MRLQILGLEGNGSELEENISKRLRFRVSSG